MLYLRFFDAYDGQENQISRHLIQLANEFGKDLEIFMLFGNLLRFGNLQLCYFDLVFAIWFMYVDDTRSPDRTRPPQLGHPIWPPCVDGQWILFL